MHFAKQAVGERHCLRCRHRITTPAIRALAMTVPGEASAACQVRHERAERAQHERHEGGLRREDVDRERGADEHAELEESRAARGEEPAAGRQVPAAARSSARAYQYYEVSRLAMDGAENPLFACSGRRLQRAPPSAAPWSFYRPASPSS